MFYEPQGHKETSDITMQGSTKEALLDHLHNILKKHNPHIQFNTKVSDIHVHKDETHTIETNNGTFQARRTILATGKSGHARKLGITGELLDHVTTSLYDPTQYRGKHVLVVGGGDSALESASLLVQAGALVTLSYRKKEFSRPKPDNIQTILTLQKEKRVTVLFESVIEEIREDTTDINVQGSITTKSFNRVFLMIGTELPYEFFEKCGITIENAKNKMTYWWMTVAISFMNIIYFGKASNGLTGHAGAQISNIVSGSAIDIIFKLIAWISVVTLLISSLVVVIDLVKRWKYYFNTKWQYIKGTYFIFVLTLFLLVFFGNKYFSFDLGNKDPFFWYGFLYTITILLFGIRRIAIAKKKYVTWQLFLLLLFKHFPFLLFQILYFLGCIHMAGFLHGFLNRYFLVENGGVLLVLFWHGHYFSGIFLQMNQVYSG